MWHPRSREDLGNFVAEKQVAVLERANRIEQAVTRLGFEHASARAGCECIANKRFILHKREDECIGAWASPANARRDLDSIRGPLGQAQRWRCQALASRRWRWRADRHPFPRRSCSPAASSTSLGCQRGPPRNYRRLEF